MIFHRARRQNNFPCQMSTHPLQRQLKIFYVKAGNTENLLRKPDDIFHCLNEYKFSLVKDIKAY